MTVSIRDATPADVAELTRIAHAAKAHWGYPAEWREAWRGELTITPATLERWAVRVAADGDAVLAFAATSVRDDGWELEHLWVRPAAIGGGLGRLLLRDALDRARAAGAAALSLIADPHATGFYLRAGARHVGDVAAPMPGAPERAIPRLRVELAAAAAGDAAAR